MRPEIKELWVNALESGEYKQGTGRLAFIKRNNWVVTREFCCLGVLCELAYRAGIVRIDELPAYIVYGGSTDYLPLEVRNWAELPISPAVQINGTDFSLASLNDGVYSEDTGWTIKTFQEIANLIKEQL